MSAVIVPSADLNTLRAADADRTASAAAHEALDQACQEHGFFLLTGHGLDDVFDRMWHASAAFFASARSNKLTVLRSQTQALGYYDRELTKRKRDLKEVFDYTEPRRLGERDPNQWPAQPPGFQDTLAEFYSATGSLALELLTLLGRTLAFGATRSAGAGAREALAAAPLTMPAGSPRHSNVRLNHYPTTDPLDAPERAQTRDLGDMALHHHTDPGLITLLLQDSVGGLQTQTRAGDWIDVPADPGAVVVNLGDAFAVLSNDRYRAAVHRVLPMRGQARYSTPYFLNPQPDAVLEPLAPLAAAQGPRYRPVIWREYIQARIDDNYTDLGADDTQISHYRIATG